jgi:hypothetical protein
VQGNLGTPFDGEGTVFVFDGTSPAAIRAGVFGPQGSGLLIQEDAQGALGQAGRGCGGDLLHGSEVEGASPLGADAAGDDFAPLGSERADLGQLLLRRFVLRHGQPHARLATILADAFLFSLYRPVLAPAKRVLASRLHKAATSC